ncbi:hypothetical protein KCP77_04645 [Salmonella enterica subsp. enterica]|nr:hypothetical protein KCP77_04645 [Salmonella enterica subsp. enterica]
MINDADQIVARWMAASLKRYWLARFKHRSGGAEDQRHWRSYLPSRLIPAYTAYWRRRTGYREALIIWDEDHHRGCHAAQRVVSFRTDGATEFSPDKRLD